MTENASEQHRYFHHEFTQETFIFLNNLLSFNLDSRRLMANAILNALYKPLKNGEGDFNNLDAISRMRLLNLTTLEILSKVYMALEDLGKILISAKRPLREFPETFGTLEQKRSLSAFREFARKPEQDICSLFPLWKPERYGLKGEDATVLNEYNQKVATFAKKALTFFANFVDRHDSAYNRYKHGIPVMVGLQTEMPAAGIDGIIGIIRDGKDLKNAGFILVGDTVVEKFVGFIDDVVYFSKLLIERRLQMAELTGMPPPLLCHGIEKDKVISYNAFVFGGIDEELQRSASPLLKRVLKRQQRTTISITVNAEIDPHKLEDWVDFYSRDWKID